MNKYFCLATITLFLSTSCGLRMVLLFTLKDVVEVLFLSIVTYAFKCLRTNMKLQPGFSRLNQTML